MRGQSFPVIDLRLKLGCDSAEYTDFTVVIVKTTKSSPLKVMREYTSLAFGPGKVSFAEYHKLRLFDDAYYQGRDKRAVIGWKRNSQINLEANFRYDWWGMLSDKIASAS